MKTAGQRGVGTAGVEIPAGPGLALRDVGAWYGRMEIVRGVTLNVLPGDGVGIVGRNGVGKTTLMRCVTRCFGVRSTGAVYLNGELVTGRRTDAYARMGVAFVPAERHIFGLTVEENLALGCARRATFRTRRDWVLDRFPLLKSKLRQRGDTLSGGEQQALAIARALMGEPQYLLLDEPSEGLAPRIVEDLGRTLREVVSERGIGLLMVERNTRLLAGLTTTVYGMSGGRVIHEGSTEAFVSDSSLRQALLAPGSSAKQGRERDGASR